MFRREYGEDKLGKTYNEPYENGLDGEHHLPQPAVADVAQRKSGRIRLLCLRSEESCLPNITILNNCSQHFRGVANSCETNHGMA